MRNKNNCSNINYNPISQQLSLFQTSLSPATKHKKYEVCCKWCGSDRAYGRLRPDTQHYGELIYNCCGRQIKWLRKPENSGEIVL